MSNYVNNLNELINTKNEFKEIIIESGQTPGEVFSYYPNMIRNAIAAGGGSLVDYPTYTYVATYYPDFTYLFSYVGDALSGIDVDIDLSSYVTKDELSAQSYATTTDLSNYLPYLGVLQAHYTNSEHFLPKTNNTYYLGNTNFKWQRIYTYNLYTDTTYTANLYADNIHNFIWTGTSAEYAALDNYTSYQIYMIKES